MRHGLLHWALLGVVLAAFGLRVLWLDAQELRGDEAFGYFFSQRSYAEIVRATLALAEPHPVASYFVQKAWMNRAGDSEFALRFVSVWWSVLAVALLYRLAYTLGLGKTTALLSALLLAVSPYAIWHSQDARMYGMSLALTVAGTWLMLEVLDRRHWRWVACYVVVSWLALQTHYFAAFVIGAQALFGVAEALGGHQPNGGASALKRLGRGWRFWDDERWIGLLYWGGAQIGLALLYLPWLRSVWGVLGTYQGNGDSPSLWEMLWRSFGVFAVGESMADGQRLFLGLMAVGLVVWGVFGLWQSGTRGRRGLALLLPYLWLPLLATWLSSQTRPLFNERYLIAAAPPFYVLLAAAITYFLAEGKWQPPTFAGVVRWPHAMRILATALLVLVLGGAAVALHHYFTDPAYSKTRGWRALAAQLDALSAGVPVAQVRLAQNYPDPTLWYYYRGAVAHLVLPPAANDSAATRQAVADLVQEGVVRVVTVVQPSPGWDEEGAALAALSGRFTVAHTVELGSWQVATFVRAPAVWQPLAIGFQNGVTLTDYALSPDMIVPGGLLAVHLRWGAARSQLTGTEKVFVHLVDEAGTLVAQEDREFASALDASLANSGAVYGILMPQNAASGGYRLLVGLYDPALEGAPRVLTQAGGDSVELGELPFYSKELLR